MHVENSWEMFLQEPFVLLVVSFLIFRRYIFMISYNSLTRFFSFLFRPPDTCLGKIKVTCQKLSQMIKLVDSTLLQTAQILSRNGRNLCLQPGLPDMNIVSHSIILHWTDTIS